MLWLNTSTYLITSQVNVILASPRSSVMFVFSLRVGQMRIPDMETQNVLRGERRGLVSGGPTLVSLRLDCGADSTFLAC